MLPQGPSTVEMIEAANAVKPGRFNLNWWYRFAAPPEPAATVDLKQREAYRRGRLISIALLGIAIIFIILLPTADTFINRGLLLPHSIMLLGIAVAVMLNRRGNVIRAGILTVIGLDVVLIFSLLSFPKMTVFLLPLLDMFVLTELIAAALLPASAIFVVALGQIVFVIVSLTIPLFSLDAELKAIMHGPTAIGALMRPAILQALVALVLYLFVQSATKAIARADRATVIAAFERALAEQGQAEIEQKRQLEMSIQQIVQVHMRVANGDLQARVPLTQGNVLWEIAGSLNTLLARFQRMRQDSFQLQQTQRAFAFFLQAQQKTKNGFIHWQPTGTLVDTIVLRHNSSLQSPAKTKSLREFSSPEGFTARAAE